MMFDFFLGAALAVGQVPTGTALPASLPKAMPAPANLPTMMKQTPAPMPAPTAPAPTVPAPVQAAPAPAPAVSAQPLVLKDGETLVANGDGTYRIEGGAAPSADAPAGEEPAADEGPSTPFMKLVDGTFLGSLLKESNTTISGFVDLRYTAANVNKRQLPPGLGFSFNPDVPQLNWVRVDRPVDKDSNEASFGYHVDLILYGSVYQNTLPRGLANDQLTARNGNPNQYGYDPVQHYVEGYFPNVMKGLDVKVGRVFARFGVENLDASATPLTSYSYAFTYNPYTYTGVTTDLAVTDKLTISNDFFMGNDAYFDAASRFFWLGAVNYAFTDKTSIRGAVIYGDNTFDVEENFNNQALVDVVFTHKFTDKLTYNFEYLYGWQRDVPDVGFASWDHYVNYLTYAWCDKHSTTARVEFFNDTDGNRTGTRGQYRSFTLGHNWKPLDWLQIRPEVRYDHNNNAPFDGRKDFFAFTTSAIIQW